MSESEYAHECMRAELLGLPKPDKDSIPPRPAASEEDGIESEMAEADQVKVPAEEGAELQDEQRAQGGMDGVHNILSLTQKKLNNIKCGIGNVGSSFSSSLSGGLSGLSGLSGSLSGFIKQRVGGGEGGPSGGEIPEAADESMESSGPPSTAIDRQMLK